MSAAPKPVRRLTAAPIGAARRALAHWYHAAKRDLPWRRTSDPYRVWLSEIMLQQTRVAAVIPYYERFLRAFPKVEDLASANESDLLTAWSGLGYYARARNLQRAAQEIVRRGGFPSTFEGWLELPGVGVYTAAAVSSIVYGERQAVVDGNVLRVLARMTGDASDIGSPKTRVRFQERAQEFLGRGDAGVHNQAVMELGATVCLPRGPQCLICPVAEWCVARREGRQRELPVKLREKKRVELRLRLFVVEHEGAVLLWRRHASNERMMGFWELPEADRFKRVGKSESVGIFSHTILHFHHEVEVYRMRGTRVARDCEWIPVGHLKSLPISTLGTKALRLAGLIYKSEVK